MTVARIRTRDRTEALSTGSSRGASQLAKEDCPDPRTAQMFDLFIEPREQVSWVGAEDGLIGEQRLQARLPSPALVAGHFCCR